MRVGECRKEKKKGRERDRERSKSSSSQMSDGVVLGVSVLSWCRPFRACTPVPMAIRE